MAFIDDENQTQMLKNEFAAYIQNCEAAKSVVLLKAPTATQMLPHKDQTTYDHFDSYLASAQPYSRQSQRTSLLARRQ